MSQVNACLLAINQAAKGFMPQVGMVLGSGLGSFADQIDAIASISFDDLPGFPQAGVGGHAAPWSRRPVYIMLSYINVRCLICY